MSDKKTGIPLQSLLFPHSPHFKTSKFYCNILPIFIVLHAKKPWYYKNNSSSFSNTRDLKDNKKSKFLCRRHYEKSFTIHVYSRRTGWHSCRRKLHSSIFCSGSEKGHHIFWRFKPVSNSRSNGTWLEFRKSAGKCHWQRSGGNKLGKSWITEKLIQSVKAAGLNDPLSLYPILPKSTMTKIIRLTANGWIVYRKL